MTARPDAQHQQYLEHSSAWRKISDCLRGGDHIRDCGDLYLPQLAEHIRLPALYTAYNSRALFSDMTSRVVSALTGCVMRKDPTVQVPGRYKARLEDIDNRGNNIRTFAKKVVEQVLAYGRVGILVDSAAASITDLPHLVMYKAEDIINWRSERIGGREVLTQVILRECVEAPGAFGTEIKTQYRSLELLDGVYSSTTHTATSGDTYVAGDPSQPADTLRQPLGLIPFFFLSAVDLSPDVHRSPVAGLADVDLSWYRSSADLEHARHLVASPTLVISSAHEAMDLTLGGVIWLPEGSTAQMLEFRGDGVQFLERALEEKERVAATLGARLLSAQTRGSEAAETLRLRQSSETSVISSLARTVSEGLTRALQIACQWGGIPGKVSFELNQDFMDEVLSAPELKELRETALAGLLPLDDFILNLQAGEIIRSDLSLDEVRDLLENDMLPGVLPVAMAQPVDQQGQPVQQDQQAAQDESPAQAGQ